MKLDYRVHTIAKGSVSKEIKLENGEMAQAVQPGVVVELVPVDGYGSSVSLSLSDAYLEKNKAADLFKSGATIQLHFTKGGN